MLFASTHSSCSVQCCASHQHMLSITLSHANFTLSHDAVNSQLTSYGHDFNVTCALSHSVSFLFTSEHTHTRVTFFTGIHNSQHIHCPQHAPLSLHNAPMYHVFTQAPSQHYSLRTLLRAKQPALRTLCSSHNTWTTPRPHQVWYYIGGCVDTIWHPLIFILHFTQCISTLMDIFPHEGFIGQPRTWRAYCNCI